MVVCTSSDTLPVMVGVGAGSRSGLPKIKGTSLRLTTGAVFTWNAIVFDPLNPSVSVAVSFII